MKRGKKYVEAAKAIDRGTLYDVADAVALVKKTAVAKFDVACFLDQNCCRWCLCDEAKASIVVNCDNYRDDHISLICCLSVELLCEFNDVYTVLSKSWSNRWCRSCFAGRNL